MSTTASRVGRSIPTSSAKLRPVPETELAAYGGPRLFRGKRVLDIGTGDGRLALAIARWARDVVGLDPDETAIREARAKTRGLGARNVRFAVGAAQELPFPDGVFDVVVLSWAL